MAKTSKLRFQFARALAMATYRLTRRSGNKNAEAAGKRALKICPDFLAHFSQPETLICVTGTNGKSTSGHLLSTILTDCGHEVIVNDEDTKTQAGIAQTLMLNADRKGRLQKPVVVLEVDEQSSIEVYKYMKPDYLLCNNLMRDSDSSSPHMEFVTYVLNSSIPKDTHLVLNADDLLAARIAPECTERTYFGVSAEKTDDTVITEGGLLYCPQCHAPMQAEYIRYQHIGRLYCAACGLRSPKPDFVVDKIDRKNNLFHVKHGDCSEEYRLINDNIVNVYCFCGVLAVLSLMGIKDATLHEAFKHAKLETSQFDVIQYNDIRITMQMAKGKNSSACTQAYTYAAQYPDKHKCLVVLNDERYDSSSHESGSTSWIYDCDETALTDPSIEKIIFVGRRRWDQRARAVLAGVSEKKIVTAAKAVDGADLVNLDANRSVFVLYDSYQVDQAMLVQKRLLHKAEIIGRNHSMTIEVLYNEVANLDGDAENVTYLKETLPSANFVFTSLNETPYFASHRPDIIIMGSMSETTQRRIIDELMPYRARIEELVNDNVVFLMTGNACELFTKEIEYVTEKITVPALGLFDLTVRTDWFKRYNGKVLGNFGNITITGFRSQFSMLRGNNKKNYFMKVTRGIGINPKSNLEGMHRNNFFGTQLLGPILPNNPLFTEYLIRQAGGEADAANRDLNMAAYQQRVREFYDKETEF